MRYIVGAMTRTIATLAALLTFTACDVEPLDVEDAATSSETGEDVAEYTEGLDPGPEAGRGPWRPCGDLDPCVEGWRCGGPSHPDTPGICLPDPEDAVSCHDMAPPVQPDPTGLINVTCEAGSPHWQIRCPLWAAEVGGSAADPCTSFGAYACEDGHIFAGTFCRPQY